MLRRKLFLNALISTAIGSMLIMSSYKVSAAYAVNSTRIWGNDRYETCAKVVQEGWKTASNYAVIVNGENFPDALSASVLAKKYNAPILLTEKGKLNDNAYNELKRLNVKQAIIVGGNFVVDPSIEKSVQNMGITTQRFYGADRNETSTAVAQQIGTQNGIILATDSDFSDALSIAPIAAKLQIPIILIPKDTVPDCIRNFISGRDIPKTYVLGNSDVISDNVAYQFPNVQRITGKDKYEMNMNIIKTFEDKFDFQNIDLAYSEQFPDALSVSAFAAIDGNPIVFVGDKNDLNAKYLIADKKASVKNVYAIGGSAGIKDSELDDIKQSVGYEVDDTQNDSKTPVYYYNVENNGSSLVNDGGWIYFSLNSQNSTSGAETGLYKIKLDNTDLTKAQKLSDDFTNKIWSNNDWIYYVNYSDNNKNSAFYRVRKTGTDKQKISDDIPRYLNFDGDYIYYAKYTNSDNPQNFSIYKMKNDGTDKQIVGSKRGIYLQNVDNKIYYLNVDDNYKIYRIDEDGSNNQLISSDSAVDYMKVQGDWIYYCNVDDNDSLYRVRKDGTQRQKLNFDNSKNVNIVDNYIYYSSIDENNSGSLYSMEIDGSNKKLLSSTDCSTAVKVKDGYIYCSGYNSNGIYSIKTDGSGYRLINNSKNIISLSTAGNWIYYTTIDTASMTTNVYRMKLDGSSNQKVQ